MRCRAILFVCAFVLAGTARSQSFRNQQNSEEGATLRGVLSHERGANISNLVVEISSLDSSRIQRRLGSSSGDFEFTDIPKGEYHVRVLNFSGNLIADELASVHHGVETIQIVLPNTTIRAQASTVSLAQLMHKVPPRAEKEALSAQASWKKGDMTACIDHLQRALEIDPEYLEARHNLALVYVRLDQPENVISAYQEVLKIDRHASEAYSIISSAQARLERWGEAEATARRALSLHPADGRARFILGLSLAAQEKNDAEALKCLSDSYPAYPGARMIAARLLARQGDIAEARTQLETYLPIAPSSRRDRIQDWLARLSR